MDWDTWGKLYRRLCSTYDKAFNGEQCAAYYEALSHYSASLMEHAIARTTAVNKTFPKVAELVERCKGISFAKTYEPSQCDVCHGDGWIDAPSRTQFDEPVPYHYVSRCPQCYPTAA